ncbi:MAG: flavin reductase [Crocinitomicaceae bacterium]|nr:flavin reductase [Crocinitomicaceae bacterium]
MKHISRQDISEQERVFRLNLINSISGFKSANLIGTVDEYGHQNLAIFSSVIHLGSNPPLLGFIMRPSTVPRNTQDNIMATGKYTINHIHSRMIQNAHYTSAKFEKEISEFEACSLTPEFLNDFRAPFVKESKIKMAMNFVEDIHIKHNNTKLIIGEIEDIHIEENLIQENGIVDLNKGDTVTISGLNKYHKAFELNEFPYARITELPKFMS